MSNLKRAITFLKRQQRLPTLNEILSSQTWYVVNKNSPKLPDFAQIEPTTMCNFRCATCSRASLPEGKKNLSMTSEQFGEILRKIPSLKKVHLQGLGEPLLVPDLQKMLDLLKEKGIYSSTTTNGSLLHLEKYLELALQFDEINISFDSTTKEDFEKIRIGGNFDAVVEGITQLSERNRASGRKARVNLNFVATHLNYMQIPKLSGIASALGVNKISISQVENWYLPNEREFADSHAFVLKTFELTEKIEKVTAEFRKQLKPQGIEVVIGGYEKRKRMCTWPFKKIFITVDGFITPCCIRMNSAAFNLGSVYSVEDFSSIWNGPAYKGFREANIKDLPNLVCDNCPF